MEETTKSIDGVIEKLALISEATETMFPDGKAVVVFELNPTEFKKVQSNFRQIDNQFKQFKIDISGTEFIFLSETSLIDEISKISETPEIPKVRKDTFFVKLKRLLRIDNQTSSQS